MNDFPLVSVITPTYKRPDTLPRTIDSVLNQTYSSVEIIVVDDNNPDSEGRKRTETIMAPYADNPRVRYIKHEKNKNGSAARNTGVRNSTAKYIAFLDDDDEFLPEKIEAQVKKLESLPKEWGCCYSLAYTKKQDGPLVPLEENREGNLFLDALTRDLSFVAGSNLMVRRDVFDEVGGFDETFKRNQDKEFVTKVLHKYKIAYSQTPGVIVYVHDNHSYFKALDVDRQYIECFANYVSTLSKEEQNYFYKRTYLMMFYHAIRVDKEFWTATKLILTGKVNIFTAIGHMIKKAKKSLDSKHK